MTGKRILDWLRGTLAALLLVGAAPAHALDIKTVFNDLCDYGVLDSDTCAAKALIDCLVKTGGNSNAMLQCAGDHDPKAKEFIDIYFAAKKPDYVKLIELAGPVVACQGASAFLPPGPPKDILCSELLAPLIKSSFSTGAQIYQAAADQNWAKLVYLTGPGLGCELIDKFVGSFPGQDLLCGTVAKVIEESVKIAKDAAKSGKAAGEFLWDTGSDIIGGVGGALESACEGIGLCDDGGKKLMSANQYYKYRLFPLIHDRVLARLAKGQQNLGHDTASLNSCLTYYRYDLYKQHPAFTQFAPKVKQACDELGARLHKEADAMAVMFAAAPTPYFDASVKPLIPAMAVKGHGQTSVASLRKKITAQCVGVMRTQLPIPEPSKPGTTAWNQVCEQVGGLFQTAYLAEEKKLASVMQQLAGQGCKKEQKSIYEDYTLACTTYEGFAACQTAYAAKMPCSLVKSQADTALAEALLKQLGTKRCKIVNEVRTVPCPKSDGTLGTCKLPEKDLLCARPWKVDQCAALLGKLAGTGAASTAVKCKGDAAGLAAFATLEGQASSIMNKLNGGGGVIGSKAGLGDVKGKASAGSGSCKATWDPLAITCDKGELAAHPEITLSSCQADPNKDGADAPCYAGFSSIKPLEASATFGITPGPLALPEGRQAAGIQGRAPPGLAMREAKPVLPEGNAPARAAEPARGIGPLAVSQPDLVLAPQISVANRLLNPGGSVSLPGYEISRGRSGCEVIAEIRVHNAGTAASGPFDATWQAGGMRNATALFTGIAEGGWETQRTLLALRAGMNVLELALDASGRVAESNEGNNRYRFAVTIDGECGSAPATRLPQPSSTPLAPVMVPPSEMQRRTTPPHPIRTLPQR